MPGVPNFPQTLPAQTVVGNLAATPKEAQAIPIAALSSQLADASTINFTPAGAGAVARPVQDKERDVVALADYDTSGHFDAVVAALPTTGKFAFPGAVLLQDGAVATPSLRFAAQPTTGIARLLNSRLDIICNGTNSFSFSPIQLYAEIARGDHVNPPYTFIEDGGSGTYLEDIDQLGIAAGIIRVAQFGVQILADGSASGHNLKLWSGGGSCYTRTQQYTQVSIAAAAKTIHVMSEFAMWLLVSGNDGTNFFVDELMGIFGSTPAVKNSFTQGAPAARTYSLSASSNIQLVMAAGTYDTNTFSLQLKDR